MRRIKDSWRETVPWNWRWTIGCFLLIVVFYAVEDFRGALAWKKFLKDHPEFDSGGKDSEDFVRNEEDYLMRPAVKYSDALIRYLNNEAFSNISFERTHEFSYSSHTRKLEFPISPFRRSGVWYPSAVIKEDKDQTEKECALIILGNERDFEQFEADGRGAAIRQGLLTGNVDHEQEVKIYIRVLTYRSLAYQEFDRIEEGHSSLLRAFEMISAYDDGSSITRSNDMAVDLMSCLQLIWQRIANQQVNAEQLQEVQDVLQKIDYQRKARSNAIDFAIKESIELEQCKWSLSNRKKIAGVWTWHWEFGASGMWNKKEILQFYLNQSRWKAYVWLMPNGWLNQNKIYLCKDALFYETGRRTIEFSPGRYLAQWFLLSNPHRFDPRPTEAFIRAGIVAVAAERFRLIHNRYPSSQTDLLAEYLAEPLRDPFDPIEPLIYKLDSQGRPVIYSIGPDQKDENGKPRAPISEGDLVWRYSLPSGMSFNDYSLY